MIEIEPIKVAEGRKIFVDQYDEGVWLMIMNNGGTANCTMTREQAFELMSALRQAMHIPEPCEKCGCPTETHTTVQYNMEVGYDQCIHCQHQQNIG